MLSSTPYASRSITSRAAAKSMRQAATPLCRLVFARIKESGINGMTAQELEQALGMAGNTVRPRLVSLKEAKLITVSDEIRRSPSGRACEVLVAVERPSWE